MMMIFSRHRANGKTYICKQKRYDPGLFLPGQDRKYTKKLQDSNGVISAMKETGCYDGKMRKWYLQNRVLCKV